MLLFFRGFIDAFKTQGNKSDKSFFFYPQKSINENTDQKKKLIEQLIDECEKLARQCDELKVNHYLTFDIFILKFISSSYYPNQNHREPQVQPKMKLVRINHDFEQSCIFFPLDFHISSILSPVPVENQSLVINSIQITKVYCSFLSIEY
jgi:hypothetical protein